ncbi:MAG TPA: hypothetical protein VEL51_12495 [Vicinamibacterales bacterium]|nr:hypothetical protein [Vicinamibacterales bacterium]
MRTAAKYVAGGAALAALGYAAYASATWARYGHPARARTPEEQDPLLDRFMPLYDIVERHHIHVAAPADITLSAARELNVFDSCVARAMFKGREIVLGARPSDNELPPGLLPAALSLGWGILADQAGREIVLGAVTKPWEPNPVFRDLLPHEFATFAEPGYVKIAWTLRADPVAAGESIFRTETRAIATDAAARAKFRRYWALVSTGVTLIRRAMLGPVKADAERRVASLTVTPEMVTIS